MIFNVNENVKVKLTEIGRKINRRNFDHLVTSIQSRTGHCGLQYSLKEDGDGWSTWQMWRLMQEFGAHITMGFDPPFETNIDIPNKPAEAGIGARLMFRVRIVFKSGHAEEFDATEFAYSKAMIGNGIGRMQWTSANKGGMRLHHVNLEDVAAVLSCEIEDKPNA